MAVLFCAATVSAQDYPTVFVDTIYVTMQRAHLESLDIDGASLEVDWVHAASPALLANVGASTFYIDGVRWTFGRFGVAHRGARDVLYAQAEVGGGRAADDRFGFQKYRAGGTHTVRQGRLFADYELQHVNVMQIQETIARVGGTYVPRPTLTVRVHVNESIGGDTDSRFADARVDWVRTPEVTLFAGGSSGRSNTTAANLPGTQTLSQHEWFAGATLRTSERIETSLTFVRTTVSGVVKNALTLGWKWGVR